MPMRQRLRWIRAAHPWSVNEEVTAFIEAGCKTAMGSRLKQSGMFWTVQGANDIILSVTPDGAMR
jgi:hypothetical protein